MTNKYDEKKFFDKYSEMSRSKDGLKGAAEWPTLKQLLPDFKGKDVLDLGCGYGWHCFYAAEKGANKIIGLDISKKMLEVAEKKNKYANIEFINASLEDYTYPDASFDVVISSLAIHYIADYDKLVKNVYQSLTTGGSFIFNIEHPVFTAEGSQQFIYDENNEIKYFPIDNYFYEGEREAIFLDEKVVKYHRTLTTIINTLLDNGFVVKQLVEPQPTIEMLSNNELLDEMRRPMMLIIKANK